MRLDGLRALMGEAGLTETGEAFARLPMGLDALLAASFPVPDGDREIRRAFAADVGRDRLGLGVREEGGGLRFAFPIVVLAGSRPA